MRLAWFWILPLGAADLSLPDAAKLALAGNPALAAARRLESASEARIRQVEAAYKPRIEWRESVQGGNNPVYVFSTLLTQRQFNESNFAIPSLIRPDPVVNFQSQLTLEQNAFDFGRTRARRAESSAAKALTVEDRRRRELEVLTQTARVYFGHQLAEAGKRAAESSVRSAMVTLEQARQLRAAGRATDADVLAVEVELAAAREVLLTREQEIQVAMAALNTVLGQPLENSHRLTTPLTTSLTAPAEAPIQRPEIKAAALQVEIANARRDQADAMRRPEIGLRFMAEADRQRVVTRGGANWFAAASMRWSLFDGGQAKEMRAEAVEAAAAAREEERAIRNGVALQVRRADSALRTAAERARLSETVTGQASETLRILKNRYGAGLATVTDVLRAENALLQAETRHLAALHDWRVAAVEKAAAEGTLHGDSNELR